MKNKILNCGIFFINFSFYIDRGGNKKVGGENVYKTFPWNKI
ncbi:hypothetical protein TKV_c04040 [Thermoanaerobacter kivui]|uniref:Uncharacterized protein n=1 Tax=Thermoanaerobacter kivui TaxID=2325 RepID=A0A097AP85_THEKI|nr:hypothetical protein TKV_c04040 [Thermoanaerobacter kivui]